MIHGLSANKRTFKEVSFSPGMNVVLADRTEAATMKDTRNGLGKSTLLEIIDFCLGAEIDEGQGLGVKALEEWAFTLDITIGPNRVRVTRSTKNHKKVSIEGPADGWPVKPEWDKHLGASCLALKDWKDVLASSMFGLPLVFEEKYRPTFRSLISYFVRRSNDAYNDPFHHFRNQKEADIQVNNCFLLDLAWQKANEWQLLKDQLDGINAVQKAMKSGALQGVAGTIGQLEAEKVRIEGRAKEERQALDEFRVHPQYRQIQDEANDLTKRMQELVNANVADRGRLRMYETAVADEQSPSDDRIEALFREAGVVFKDGVKATLAAARDFHKRIIGNRRTFLGAEMERLRRRIDGREEAIKALSDQRSGLMSILKTHGALDEFARLQEQHVKTRERLEQLSTRISEMKDVGKKKRDLKVAQAELQRSAEADYEERRERWEQALHVFNENSQALYKSPGNLIINVAETGYKFGVEIQGSGSEGIGKMKIFCYDMMLAEVLDKKRPWPGFVIHDSLIYDGVDSRQRALALELAAKKAQEHSFQYICTLNSDMIPEADFSPGFKLDSYVRLRLTDKDAGGSLLGIRF